MVLTVLATVQAQIAAEKFEQGLLWRVEQPGSATSHIFGTIHLADPSVTALPNAMRDVFDGARLNTMGTSLDAENITALSAAKR